MLHDRTQTFRGARNFTSPARAARRLRLEYNSLRRRLSALSGGNNAEAEFDALRNRVDHVARNLGAIRADSVHAIESKLKVALDLADEHIDETSHKLFASALSDLHFLALLSEPPNDHMIDGAVPRQEPNYTRVTRRSESPWGR
jgi:hypothetical protein